MHANSVLPLKTRIDSLIPGCEYRSLICCPKIYDHKYLNVNISVLLHALQILPALRSFCVYCAISIIGIYILQSTVFVAIVSLDHRRFLDRRDTCCCCFKHSDNYSPNKCSQTSIIQWIFDKMYIPFLEPTAVKVN